MEFDPHIFLWLGAFVLADVISGLVAALATGSFKSSVMREGALHKLGELMALVVAVLMENVLPLIGITVQIPIVTVLLVYLVLMEISSIFENLSQINPQLAKILSRILADVNPHNDDEEDGAHEH